MEVATTPRTSSDGEGSAIGRATSASQSSGGVARSTRSGLSASGTATPRHVSSSCTSAWSTSAGGGNVVVLAPSARARSTRPGRTSSSVGDERYPSSVYVAGSSSVHAGSPGSRPWGVSAASSSSTVRRSPSCSSDTTSVPIPASATSGGSVTRRDDGAQAPKTASPTRSTSRSA